MEETVEEKKKKADIEFCLNDNADIEFCLNDNWVMKLSENDDCQCRILFNHDVFPDLCPDDFAKKVVHILETCLPTQEILIDNIEDIVEKYDDIDRVNQDSHDDIIEIRCLIKEYREWRSK